MAELAERVRESLAHRFSHQHTAMAMAAQHRDSRDYMGAETFYRRAMEGTDPRIGLQATFAAVEMFQGAGDNAAARQYAMEATMRAERMGDTAAAMRGKTAMDLNESLFARGPLIESPRTAPTVAALSSNEAAQNAKGASFNELMQGMGQMHGSGNPRMRAMFDDLNRQQDVAAEMVGTLVQDANGRFGVRDETTGRTTTVDFAWSREWALTEAAKDLGKTVHVEGTTPLWGEGKTMKVNGYHGAEHGLGPEQARGGLRITDARAVQAAHQSRAVERAIA